MERLTSRNERGNVYYPRCFEEPCNGGGSSEQCDECEYSREMGGKLAAYEDLGLEPEEIQEYLNRHDFKELHDHITELLELEEQGRLVKLPCKTGDTVYIANYDTHTITEGEVWKIGIHRAAIMLNIYIGNCIEKVISVSNFGKTVFLSREEAETALKALKGVEDE